MLHEYLEAASAGPRVPLPYRFHFFLRAEEGGSSDSDGGSSSSSSSSSEQAGAATSTAAVQDAAAAAAAAKPVGPPPGLREVVLTLPPPTRGAPGQDMSGSTRKAFGSLLAALGLPSRWAGDGEGDAAAAGYGRLVSLREFLPQAVEAVHQHAAEQVGGQWLGKSSVAQSSPPRQQTVVEAAPRALAAAPAVPYRASTASLMCPAHIHLPTACPRHPERRRAPPGRAAHRAAPGAPPVCGLWRACLLRRRPAAARLAAALGCGGGQPAAVDRPVRVEGHHRRGGTWSGRAGHGVVGA